MGELNGKVVPVDVVAFQNNRRKVDPELPRTHANQQVAWNGDGTAILASKPTDEELFSELDRLGLRVDQVVLDTIEDPSVGSV